MSRIERHPIECTAGVILIGFSITMSACSSAAPSPDAQQVGAPLKVRTDDMSACNLANDTLPNPYIYPAVLGVPFHYGVAEQFVRQTSTLVPNIENALQISSSQVTVTISPGGSASLVRPTFQTAATLSTQSCTLLAAAFGFVYQQDSVLQWQAGGGTALVSVGFNSTVDQDMASSFLNIAVGIAPALGDGFSARGSAMAFLNLRDSNGAPYSGLSDATFAADLAGAAAAYPGRPTTSTSQVLAQEPSNPWAQFPQGQLYAALLGPDIVNALEPLQQRYVQMVTAALP